MIEIVRAGRYVAAAALVAIAATACTGDDPDDAAGTQPATTTTSDAPPATSEPPPTSTGEPTGEAARCTTDDLTGELVSAEPAAGQRYAYLILTNASDEPCTITGYGGAQLVAADGADLPTNLVRDLSVPASTTTLQPGDPVQSLLHWTVVPGDGDQEGAQCQPDPATLAVIPPDETTALDVAWTLGPVCGEGHIDQRPYESAL